MKTYQKFLDFVSGILDITKYEKIILDNVHLTENDLGNIDPQYYVNNINPYFIPSSVDIKKIDLIEGHDYIVSSLYFIQTLFEGSGPSNFIDLINRFEHQDGELYFYIEDNDTRNENQVVNDIKYVSTLMKKFKMSFPEILNLGVTLYLKKEDIINALIYHGFEIVKDEHKTNTFSILAKYVGIHEDQGLQLPKIIPSPQSTIFTLQNGNIFSWLKNQPTRTETKLVEYFVSNTRYEKNSVRKMLFQVDNDEHFFTQLFLE